MPRNARPADSRRVSSAACDKDITASSLEGGGKLNPSQGGFKDSLGGKDAVDHESTFGDSEDEDFAVYIPLIKVANSDEERTVTGVVLIPEQTDAQADIYSKEVIRKAAHGFLGGFNLENNLGLQHEDMDPPFTLCESWIAPVDLEINGKAIKAGTWIMTVKVNSDKIWAAIKAGKITGFSIGGIAKVAKVPQTDTAQAA